MSRNAYICWVVTEKPWETESRIIARYAVDAADVEIPRDPHPLAAAWMGAQRSRGHIREHRPTPFTLPNKKACVL
jgi:hypothetical protein